LPWWSRLCIGALQGRDVAQVPWHHLRRRDAHTSAQGQRHGAFGCW
jgi:hypothetical protein